MLELNHMLTVLQAFLPQYWNWTHWPNKVEIKKKKWWLSGKGSVCQCRRHKFDPCSRKMPYAMEQLRLCITTTEAVL